MLSKKVKLTAGLSLVFAGTLALSACTMSGTSGMDSTSSAAPTEQASSAPEASMDPAANLVGPGCADYAAQVPSGAGSIQGMSQDPVAVAASNNPILTTLVAAVSGKLNPDVDLVSTLNGGEFTVFAPVDSAFAKIDPATIDTLKTDSALGTATPPRSKTFRPSITSADRQDRLARVRLRTLPSSRYDSRSRTAGGELRLGTDSIYMDIEYNRFSGRNQHNLPILHGYISRP